MQRSKKKKKYVEGGFGSFLQQGTNANSLLGSAGNLLGGAITANNPTSQEAGIAGGAIKGAATGAAFGPIGAAVGGVAGGVLGSLDAAEALKKEQALKFSVNTDLDKQLMANAKPGRKKGGSLLSNKLNALAGGGLVPVSKDAVEVQANDPSQTDSVELEGAFVDDSEIIDNKNRVFSDSILAPSGKTIAKEAKSLEKQKNNDPRFKGSNSRIEDKLNQLFNHQEQSKISKEGLRAPKGLASANAPEETWAGNMKKAWNGEKSAGVNTLAGRVLPTKKFGGKIGKDSVALYNTPPSRTPKTKFDGGGIMLPEFEVNAKKKQVDWNKATSGVATFLPNLVNSSLQSKLQGPATPSYETTQTLDRIDPSAQYAEAARVTGQTNNILTRNTADSGVLGSTLGSTLAKRLAANNQITGQTQHLNTQIQGQEALLNQGVTARNAQRSTDFRNSAIDFQNKKLSLSSENIANLSGKVLQQGRERNQQTRDEQALQFLKESYGDSGVLERLSQRNPELIESLKKSLGLKMGGKLKKLPTKRKGGMLAC